MSDIPSNRANKLDVPTYIWCSDTAISYCFDRKWWAHFSIPIISKLWHQKLLLCGNSNSSSSIRTKITRQQSHKRGSLVRWNCFVWSLSLGEQLHFMHFFLGIFAIVPITSSSASHSSFPNRVWLCSLTELMDYIFTPNAAIAILIVFWVFLVIKFNFFPAIFCYFGSSTSHVSLYCARATMMHVSITFMPLLRFIP